MYMYVYVCMNIGPVVVAFTTHPRDSFLWISRHGFFPQHHVILVVALGIIRVFGYHECPILYTIYTYFNIGHNVSLNIYDTYIT